MSLTKGKPKGQDQQAEAGQLPHLNTLHINCTAVFDMRANHKPSPSVKCFVIHREEGPLDIQTALVLTS